MDKLIHVRLPLELKQAETGDRLIVGYANRAIVDEVGHLIPAHVWLSGLQRYFREGMPIKLLHRPKLVVGETVWLKVNEDGLVLASRPRLHEVYGLIERGLLTAYSVGFVPKAWEDRPDGVREFTDLELVEVSYVDEPMNPGAYFEVIPKMLEGHEILFDASTGTVTVVGLKPDEMAELAALLQGALVKAGVTASSAIQAIEFKAAPAEKAEWTTAYINSLPDSSFAVIEPAYERGETEDKRCRHLPHHGPGGGGTHNENLDLPHLRNALARVNQIVPVSDSISVDELRRRAVEHLEHHRSALEGKAAEGEESEMGLLRKIWDFLRGKPKEVPEAPREEPPAEQSAGEPALEEKTTMPEEQVQLEAKFAQLQEQVSGLATQLSELKGAVEKLAQIVEGLVPPPNSTPVLDTSPKTEVKKYRWGLLGPVQ